MKLLLLASVNLLALTGLDAARAGDMPPAVIYRAGAPPSVIYPAAAPPFTFTGFYAGGKVDGALGSSKYSEAPSGTFVAVVPPTSTTTAPGALVSAPGSNIAAVGTSSTAPRGV
jgi:hypothetical protein